MTGAVPWWFVISLTLFGFALIGVIVWVAWIYDRQDWHHRALRDGGLIDEGDAGTDVLESPTEPITTDDYYQRLRHIGEHRKGRKREWLTDRTTAER